MRDRRCAVRSFSTSTERITNPRNLMIERRKSHPHLRQGRKYSYLAFGLLYFFPPDLEPCVPDESDLGFTRLTELGVGGVRSEAQERSEWFPQFPRPLSWLLFLAPFLFPAPWLCPELRDPLAFANTALVIGTKNISNTARAPLIFRHLLVSLLNHLVAIRRLLC